jgi:SdrD B-like domain
MLTNGTASSENNFVDERPGVISGFVRDDQGNGQGSVVLELKFPNGSVVATTATDIQGNYTFSLVPPGNYTIMETNSDGLLYDVSDYDTIDDGDAFDADTAVGGIVNVTLQPAETHAGNDFTDTTMGSVSGTVTSEKGEPLAN